MDLVEQAPVPGLLHPFLVSGHVVDDLGLDEVRPGVDLLGQSGHAEGGWVAEWIGGGTQEYLGTALQLLANGIDTLVTHGLEHRELLKGVDVPHGLGLGVVAQGLVVAGEAQHVLDTHGGGTQDVRLDRDPVAVPGHHLHHGFEPLVEHQPGGADRAHAHDGGLVVGHIGGVHASLEQSRKLPHLLGVGTLRGTQLAGHREMAGLQDLLQVGARFHWSPSSTSSVPRTSSLIRERGPPLWDLDQSFGGSTSSSLCS